MKIDYFYKNVKTTHFPPEEDTYTIEKKGGRIRKFVTNLLLKALSKTSDLSTYYKPVESNRIEKVTIDFKDIEKAIFEQLEMIEYNYNIKCDMIVIGRDQMRKLLQGSHYAMSVKFPSNYESSAYVKGERFVYAGLEVKFVPWIDGVIVVPKQY